MTKKQLLCFKILAKYKTSTIKRFLNKKGYQFIDKMPLNMLQGIVKKIDHEYYSEVYYKALLNKAVS